MRRAVRMHSTPSTAQSAADSHLRGGWGLDSVAARTNQTSSTRRRCRNRWSRRGQRHLAQTAALAPHAAAARVPRQKLGRPPRSAPCGSLLSPKRGAQPAAALLVIGRSSLRNSRGRAQFARLTLLLFLLPMIWYVTQIGAPWRPALAPAAFGPLKASSRCFCVRQTAQGCPRQHAACAAVTLLNGEKTKHAA